MFFIDKLHDYFKNEFALSDVESAKLRYSLEILFNDLSKFLILFFLFSILGKKSDFIYSAIALLLIRPFTGGLHFKTYSGCLLFSILFFASSIALKNFLSLTSIMISLLFISSIIAIFIFAPISNKDRPIYDDKKKKKFRFIGVIIALFHFSSFFLYKKNPYLMNSIWIIVLQSIQLLIAKGGEMYEKNKNNAYKTTQHPM
ncbi:MAG: accessory gene regulator B family protein [Epulopiscium sp.]|mgnify:CR=1 FL=1|nr:accessory gene regulator B family protein [Candidatus Epulonipiscium sp.]